MRLLHTSDWHLGRTLCGERRDATFKAFLDWLLELIDARAIDTLLIAGDIFDSAMPPISAQNQYYEFLAALRTRTACRNVIIVSGNHDSALFLDAPGALLNALNIRVIGRAAENPEDSVVAVTDSKGATEAVVCAVPFLRESDLHTLTDADTLTNRTERITESVAGHYRKSTDAALRLYPALEESLPLIVTGHLFARGGKTGTNERELYVGSLGDVPDSVFPPEADYVALGHLHRPQTVAGNPAHRYCGSPMALDFSEAAGRHCVNLVTFNGKTPAVEEIDVPAFDRLAHIEGDEAAISEGLAKLAQEKTPVLAEVIHTGDTPLTGLEKLCRDVTEKSCVKILRVSDRGYVRAVLSGQDTAKSIADLTPEEIFELLLKQKSVAETEKEALRTAYRSILETLAQNDVPAGDNHAH